MGGGGGCIVSSWQPPPPQPNGTGVLHTDHFTTERSFLSGTSCHSSLCSPAPDQLPFFSLKLKPQLWIDVFVSGLMLGL